MRHLGYFFVAASLLPLVGCSKEKEQCHALVLAVTEADNAYTDLSAAAARGKRPEFERASKEFEAAVGKIGAVAVNAGSMRGEELSSTKGRYLQAAPKIVPAYRHLLEAVEKDPKLGEKFSGGVPPLSAAGDVSTDVTEADNEVTVLGRVTRQMKCE